jgi:D-beta-D-heptose 7-phosphate kinase/D-beta-D-heptose 1-phosphate adenosyltransferase
MIVGWDGLAALRGQVTMVDGGFDPLHPGHVSYFKAAAELGDPVLCNVSGDDWVARKHRPLLAQHERGELIDAIRWISYVHLSATSTADVLAELQPRRLAKGDDWCGKLPPDELAVADDHGIEIVFLDTVRASSTALLERWGSE